MGVLVEGQNRRGEVKGRGIPGLYNSSGRFHEYGPRNMTGLFMKGAANLELTRFQKVLYSKNEF